MIRACWKSSIIKVKQSKQKAMPRKQRKGKPNLQSLLTFEMQHKIGHLRTVFSKYWRKIPLNLALVQEGKLHQSSCRRLICRWGREDGGRDRVLRDFVPFGLGDQLGSRMARDPNLSHLVVHSPMCYSRVPFRYSSHCLPEHGNSWKIVQ